MSTAIVRVSSASTEHRDGLPTAIRPRRASISERLWAALLALGALAVLATAAWLEPSEEGHGTHERLGLRPCVWVATMDTPCPTCGMTTAFSHAADADFRASFATQPLGMALSVLSAAAFWVLAHVSITGSTAARLCTNLLGGKLLWISLGALLAAWAYKLVTWGGS